MGELLGSESLLFQALNQRLLQLRVARCLNLLVLHKLSAHSSKLLALGCEEALNALQCRLGWLRSSS